MMAIVRVPENNNVIVQDFIDKSMFTFEGLDITDKKGLKEMEKLFRENGYDKKDFLMYVLSGKQMNEYFGLTDENAYPEDLNIVVIPDFYNIGIKVGLGARWFDDIVASNSIRQNALKTGLEPDYN